MIEPCDKMIQVCVKPVPSLVPRGPTTAIVWVVTGQLPLTTTNLDNALATLASFDS
jgi:hypothetical protein